MYKKIVQVLLIIAALAVIGYVYYKFSSKDSKPADSIDAIPSNVTFLLEVSGFTELDKYMPLLQSMAGHKNELSGVSFNPLSEWPALISEMDSLRSLNENWMATLQQSSILLACTEQGRGDSWIASIGLTKSSASSVAADMMSAWKIEIDTRDFKGTKVHMTSSVQWAVIQDCLVISKNGSLIEDAIIRSDKKDLLKNNIAFIESRNVMSKDLPLHFYTGMDKDQWLQLDPTFINGHSSLSGYAILSDSTRHSFRLTAEGAPFKIQNALPDNTSLLDIYSYSDFEAGWKLHEKYFDGSTASAFWSQAWKDYGDTCQCDLNESLLSWRSGEWGSAVIAINDSSTAEVSFFGIKDTTDVISVIRPILMEQHVTPDGIYKVKYPALFERNQQQNILIEANYITQKNNFIFTAATPSELKAILSFTSPLAETNSFQKSLKSMNGPKGRFIYQTEYFTSPLPTVLLNTLSGYESISTSVEHMDGNKYLVNISLPFEDNNAQESTPTAENSSHEINTPIEAAHGPWKVINHNTKEEEVLLQNKDMEICLTDKQGKLLWKKKVSGEVLGNVVQIDALKNGKLQYAFTTDAGLYILDRNGNELSGFPFLPKAPVTSPLHVADYDNNKKYRLLFAMGDGLVENLGIDGKQTTGWKHQSENQIITCIDDFKIGADDHLLTVSITGKIGIYKRTGEVKNSVNTTLEDYNGKSCQIKAGSTLGETQLIFTTKKGETKQIKLGDK